MLLENTSLKPYNTFGIDASARWFGTFASLEDLQLLLADHHPELVIGGGSNILLTKDINGLVVKNEIPRIEKIGEDETHVYVKAGAGVNWHHFVLHCIENNWAGVENLSLIPGCVGASPMQNIGAYGVEMKETFHELSAWHLQDKAVVGFGWKDCEFGYRESVFKRKCKGMFIILDVTFKLCKYPRLNTSYGAIEQELERMGIRELTIKAISDAVIHIRSSKLPDPNVIGNAGSFFKNPEIEGSIFSKLQSKAPGIIGYALENGNVKIAAGWLIEQCGWKGYRDGDAGVHAKQALVLVNYGSAKGTQLYDLSEKIIVSVYQKFGIELEREVNIL